MSSPGRDPATEEPNTAPEEGRARQALTLMEQALLLIDADEGPQDAGAYLDNAIHRLRDWINKGTA